MRPSVSGRFKNRKLAYPAFPTPKILLHQSTLPWELSADWLEIPIPNACSLGEDLTDSDGMHEEHTPPTARKACQRCHALKKRCDRVYPLCLRCHMSKSKWYCE